MYNAVTNGWTDFEHQITFDVRQPKTRSVHDGAAAEIHRTTTRMWT
ncbi:MAG: 1,3-beta-galactosyl-N-acetylhexosamine phosphorylase N-terminal domain-containing protein [Intestinimonas sp.]